MSLVDIGSARLACRVFGKGPIAVVVEAALNACGAEWWALAASLAEHGVLVYERAGYGESTVSSLPRSPLNIVLELEALLARLETRQRLVLVGHSQGGLYASLFALRNPSRVKALVLLDPLSFSNGRFRAELTAREYAASGVDKTAPLKTGKILSGLGLSFLFKGLLKGAPPFFYARFEPEAERAILRALTQKKQYATALAEYQLSQLADPALFGGAGISAPLVLVRHHPERVIGEIMHYGGCERPLAEKIERLWQSVMRDMLGLGKDATEIESTQGSHYLHLSDPDLVRSVIMGQL